MKVLISGATGLVGSELVSLLLKNGIQINYLTTSKDKVQDEDLYKGYYWDPENGIIDEKCIDGVNTVIHLAGAPIAKKWTQKYKQEILESRTLSANVICGLIKKKENEVGHFISASAIGIYPDSLDNVYSEDTEEVDNSFLGTVVEKWEAAADNIGRLGIKVAKVRTGLVLSKKGGMLPEMVKPVRFGLGSAFGSGKQIQSWIHIDDLSAIYYYIMDNELEGVYNAVAPYPVTQNELVKNTAKILGKPYFMPNVPKFVMETMLGEMHMLLYTSQNVSAKKILNEGYQFKYLSLEKALKDEFK